MPKNKVQFQKGLSIPEFMEKYGTEEKCEKALFNARWFFGYKCASCGHDNYCYIRSRKVYQCTRCKHQTSVIRNTVFHSTNLPLTKWFLAMYLIVTSKNGISALELSRQIGVSYNTAWSIKHKIMQAMVERDSHVKLAGLITADDTYLGGQRKNGKRGRGSENKQPFIAAVRLSEEGHPRQVKLTPVQSFTKCEVEKWASENLHSKCIIVSDGLSCFNAFAASSEHKHIKVVMKPDPITGEIPYFTWLSTIVGNVKSAITGTYRSSRKGYCQRYLAEFQYRLNRRFDLKYIFKSILFTAAYTAPLSGMLLRKAANYT